MSENVVNVAADPDRMVRNPLVSVLMITYNHVEYLAEAIEGVVSQQCDFPFELIIGEDASTDDTVQVALDYQARYPALIRVMYSDSNVGVKANALRVLQAARGKYLAYCEGDDFWCAPDKLAAQVAILENAPEVGVVHTDWVRARKQSGAWVVSWDRSVLQRVPHCLLHGDIFRTFHYPKVLRTCTALRRRELVLGCVESPLGKVDYGFGDTVYNAFITARSKVAYLPQVTAVYRLSPNSVLRSGVRARLRFLRGSLRFDSDARVYFRARGNYPTAYRFELGVGLLLWGIRAGDFAAVREAVADLARHNGPLTFIRDGWRSLWMRRPAVTRRLSRSRPRNQ